LSVLPIFFAFFASSHVFHRNSANEDFSGVKNLQHITRLAETGCRSGLFGASAEPPYSSAVQRIYVPCCDRYTRAIILRCAGGCEKLSPRPCQHAQKPCRRLCVRRGGVVRRSNVHAAYAQTRFALVYEGCGYTAWVRVRRPCSFLDTLYTFHLADPRPAGSLALPLPDRGGQRPRRTGLRAAGARAEPACIQRRPGRPTAAINTIILPSGWHCSVENASHLAAAFLHAQERSTVSRDGYLCMASGNASAGEKRGTRRRSVTSS